MFHFFLWSYVSLTKTAKLLFFFRGYSGHRPFLEHNPYQTDQRNQRVSTTGRTLLTVSSDLSSLAALASICSVRKPTNSYGSCTLIKESRNQCTRPGCEPETPTDKAGSVTTLSYG